MEHSIVYCECGILMSRCKCIMHSSIRTVGPCIHVITTEFKTSPINELNLLDAKIEVELLGGLPNLLRCSPKAYNDLRIYYTDKDADEVGVYKREYEPFSAGEVMGTQILIDHKLKPGEWRFEKRFFE